MEGQVELVARVVVPEHKAMRDILKAAGVGRPGWFGS